MQKLISKSYLDSPVVNSSTFVICGPTCAGKTTIAEYLVSLYQYYHIEASDFMYLNYYEKYGMNSDVKIGDFSLVALNKNPFIVTERIIEHIGALKSTPLVITGFRDPKEVENFFNNYNGYFNLKLLFIDASQEIRFQRSIDRDRHDTQRNLEDFKKIDTQQNKMGLPEIKLMCSDSIIENNATKDEFYNNFSTLYKNQLAAINKTKSLNPMPFKTKKLQNAIIRILATQYDITRYYSKSEIEQLMSVNNDFNPTIHSITQYFEQKYHPYYEIKVNEKGDAMYRLSQTGMSYSKFIQ